jgi:hypothetical protein
MGSSATFSNTVYNSDNVGELQRVELVLDVVGAQDNNTNPVSLTPSTLLVMSFKKDEESGGMCTCLHELNAVR